MQPYLFPYIGYFQLIHRADIFVFYDDTQYIKNGWINRNRILNENGGEPLMIALPVKKGPHSANINEREFACDKRNKKLFIKRVVQNYRKSPNFCEVIGLIEDIVSFPESNVSSFAMNSIRSICSYLAIETPLIISSQLEKDDDLKGEQRIIKICRRVGATHYINPIGGTELYSREVFARAGLRLEFLKTKDTLRYAQFGTEFCPHLSIIDVMMFCKPAQIAGLLGDFEIEEGR